ncbi:hypothetical protein LJE71_22600 [Xanthobacter autotrophicus]|uniref:hypothetical protein n=1 Tax=Xanthobacter autotrophicus TaxID=280 RepID=UPI001E59DDBE|nr:hypothetical protein [Xanthobacter autotrophicus]UDQ88973.1 hypothetical protein LJE71_22600 [Xanthobacter autotrophicus]
MKIGRAKRQTFYTILEAYQYIADRRAQRFKSTQPASKYYVEDQEMNRVIARVSKFAGGVKGARDWYTKYNIPEFGGVTAEFLVKQGRVNAVIKYLNHLEDGGYV